MNEFVNENESSVSYELEASFGCMECTNSCAENCAKNCKSANKSH